MTPITLANVHEHTHRPAVRDLMAEMQHETTAAFDVAVDLEVERFERSGEVAS